MKMKPGFCNKMKSRAESEAMIERLNMLDDIILSATLDDIRSGNVSRKILLPLIRMVADQMKNHPDFQHAPGQYVSGALTQLGNEIDPARAFMLKRGSRNKNNIVDDKRIALRAWHRINGYGEKTIAVFKSLSSSGKGAATVKKLYERYQNHITNTFKSTDRK